MATLNTLLLNRIFTKHTSVKALSVELGLVSLKKIYSKDCLNNEFSLCIQAQRL